MNKKLAWGEDNLHLNDEILNLANNGDGYAKYC